MKENFAPLAESSFTGDDLVLPFDKTVVKDSPDIADASHLTPTNSNPCTGITSSTSAPTPTGPPSTNRPPAVTSTPLPPVTPGISGARDTTPRARTPTRR
jgi:hypothetical protein